MFNGYNYFPFQGVPPRLSLFNSLKGLNFSDILSGTQKTLNVINQAIPIFYQIRPLWNNTKTIFKIANAINEDDNKNDIQNDQDPKIDNQQSKAKTDEPVFFL